MNEKIDLKKIAINEVFAAMHDRLLVFKIADDYTLFISTNDSTSSIKIRFEYPVKDSLSFYESVGEKWQIRPLISKKNNLDILLESVVELIDAYVSYIDIVLFSENRKEGAKNRLLLIKLENVSEIEID